MSETRTVPADSAAQEMKEVDSLVNWISGRTGLSFRDQRQAVDDRIREWMQQAGDRTAHASRRRLMDDQAAFDALVGDLTIGETYFFRDQRQFALIVSRFLPAMRTLRPRHHRLRVWSAGCASGEEAWSLAALLSENLHGSFEDVLATDISRAALKRARAGRYGAWSMRGPAREKMGKCVVERNGRFEISEHLRRHVRFEYLNLAADQYPSSKSRTRGLDLILCRNVLIYFDAETTKAVARRMFDCLSPGGWLITGPSDPVLTDYAPFDVQACDAGLFYIRPESLGDDGLDQCESSGVSSGNGTFHTTAPVEPPVTSVAKSAKASRPTEPVRHVDDTRDRPRAHIVEAHALQALDRGDFNRALELTSEILDRESGSVLHARALAGIDTRRATEFVAEALQAHPVCVELHYLQTMLLLDLRRYADAELSARRVVFLDRHLVVGHFALGSVLQQLGEFAAARRSFRNAERLCESLSAEQVLPLSDGETAKHLCDSARKHLEWLDKQRRDR